MSKAISDMTIERLNRAQARREKRLQNMRTVYAYRTSAGLCDNLILLPTATEMAHKEYLRNNLKAVLSGIDDISAYADCEVLRLGRFDKLKCEFSRQKVNQSLFTLVDIIDEIKKEKKK